MHSFADISPQKYKKETKNSYLLNNHADSFILDFAGKNDYLRKNVLED